MNRRVSGSAFFLYYTASAKTGLIRLVTAIGTSLKTNEVLDIGCGSGRDAMGLQKRTGWRVWGVDAQEPHKAFQRGDHLRFVRSDIERLHPGLFDGTKF